MTALGCPPAVGGQHGEAAGAEPEVLQRAHRARGCHALCPLRPGHAVERGALQHRAPRQPAQLLQLRRQLLILQRRQDLSFIFII